MNNAMLEIFKSRLPEGLEIKKIKDRSNANQMEIILSYEGTEVKTWLYKTCTPGKAEKNCDYSIYTSMAQVFFLKNDFEKVQYWLRKQNELMRGA